MSEESLKLMQNAIHAHVRDAFGTETVLCEWFLGFSLMGKNVDSPDGIGYQHDYVTSNSSPYAILGTAQATLADLVEEIADTDLYEHGCD